MACSRSFYCIFCISFVVFIGSLLAILTTLSYVGMKPRFYVQQIYVPALNNSRISNATNLDDSIFIDLKFERLVVYLPLRYEDLSINLFYGSNRSFCVGYYVVPGFYQGRKKTVHRKAVVEARGLLWEEAFQKISGGLTVVLAVELATKYKLKQCDGDGDCSYSKPKAVVVAADVQLNGSGEMVSRKPLRLH